MDAAQPHQIRNSILRAVVGANFLAAGVSFVLLNLLILQPEGDLLRSVIVFAVVSAVAFPGSAALGAVLFRPVERWVAAGRPPTAQEAAIVIGGPRLVAVVTFGFWIVTALVNGAGEAIDGGPPIEGLRTFGALVAAGLTSAALSYLLVERRARPLVAVALDGSPPERSASLGLRPRLVLAWALGSGVPLLAIVVGEVSIGPNDPRVTPLTAVFLAGIGLVVGALVTMAAVRSIAEPIAAIRNALAAVQRGELSVRVPVDDGGEIGQLQAGVNEMAAGLQERQRLADLFGRHVGTEVAARALAEGVVLGGERRLASAVFVDLRNSTGLAAASPPEAVVALLNRFFQEIVRVVSVEGGWVNKFEGDGALCIFGVLSVQPDHAARALRASRTLQRSLAGAGLEAAIGVSSGDVVAGNVGAEERFEYTVIGDAVNEAARLTQAAKEVAGNVLASGAAIEHAGDESAHWEFNAELHLRGRSGPTRAFTPRQGRKSGKLRQ